MLCNAHGTIGRISTTIGRDCLVGKTVGCYPPIISLKGDASQTLMHTVTSVVINDRRLVYM